MSLATPTFPQPLFHPGHDQREPNKTALQMRPATLMLALLVQHLSLGFYATTSAWDAVAAYDRLYEVRCCRPALLDVGHAALQHAGQSPPLFIYVWNAGR
ncbi:hypothetical protein C8035_v009610 [Colletotrichum spinosum]|uniref:Uncharacterized protein n=1 Tax=Colletotrichum spinosum TaxID=1347390 RepID=A0A4R8Q9Q9_9PEZI|nr:hypothetical protein C8035_v009610 [Colletotrichum spinosum]